MPPNIAFASSPAALSGETLKVSGPSDPVFVSIGEGIEADEARLVSRSVTVQQGDAVVGGPASLGESKSWTATIDAPGLTAGAATATGVEVYGFVGAQSPLTMTFSWSQDIELAAG